ncbi:molybdopterin-dependent oxidoreductase [Candidatus Bathyarchaeota archaeon]|nr:molybdopterin-dependent oxidoreductase [Candidatus Bathyarchaeota archaeon]
MDRRDFLKLAGAASAGSLILGDMLKLVKGQTKPSEATSQKWENYTVGERTPSICPYCAGGCGLMVTTLGDQLVEIEGDPIHPINGGALCSKAAAVFQLVTSDRRLTYPMKRTNPNKGKDEDPMWERITWEEAYEIIANKVKDALTDFPYKQGDDYYYKGKDNPVAWLGSSYWNNEECYLGKKLISLLGSTNVEHQARKCHASTVVALANTFGFGAMTNHIVDAKNSKCFLIVSNPAESHTMEFKWVQKAIENGAKVIVLDPRFNRSGSKAHIFARFRSGTEAALFLGMIRYVLYEKPERVDWDFLENRTSAPYRTDGTGPYSDWKEEASDSIFIKLKNIVAPYTPEEVERIAGIPQAKFIEVIDTFSDPVNNPGNIYYSMGTTQHTNAVQAIRAQAILQLILGNMGVPGGGINALRGISNVQGSTDANLLSHLIMGYRGPPRDVGEIRRYQKWKNGGGPGTSADLDADAKKRGGNTSVGRVTYPWASIGDAETAGKATEFRYDDRHFPTWNALEYHWGVYVGTWPGVDPDNEPVVCDLPVGFGNPIVQLFRAINDGKIKVLICNGENPAVSVANANLVREALSKDSLFLVVNELFETETAVYADILLPGTTQVERDGSITNTGRWIQWRWKAKNPPGECKPELTYLTELYWKIREVLKSVGIKLPSEKYEEEHAGVDIKKTIGTADVQNNPELCWPSRFVYTDGFSAEAIYKEYGAKSIIVGGVELPQSAANVLYKNSYDPTMEPELNGILPKRRDPTPVDLEDAKYGYFKNWAFSWMLNQRVLYNDKESNAGLKTFLVWFATAPNAWLGHTLDKAALWSKPLHDPSKPATNPLSQAMPLHNEPLESPDSDLATQYPTMWDNRYPVTVGTSTDYPYVLTTFRLAEHMQAGAMTRNLPWLVEAHPSMFVEMSKELAGEIGVNDGDDVVVKTARKPEGIVVKALVTDRIQPFTINGKTVHEVAMPWHWGFKGLSTGPSANEITIDSVDVSANIPEVKVCLCKVEKA